MGTSNHHTTGGSEQNQALQAIIFDMDGVLTATVEYHYQSWKKAVAAYGIDFTRKDNDKLLGLTRRRSLEVILGPRQISEEQMQSILTQKNAYYQEFVRSMSPDDLLPGARELIAEMKKAGIRLGVASGSRNAGLILDRLGVSQDMDVILDGSRVKRSKPDPDIFLKTSQALGVPPESCLVMEDSQAGVQAALSANMCVVGIGPEDRLQLAHAVFPSLSRVRFRILKAIYELWRNARPVEWRRQPQTGLQTGVEEG